MRNKSALDSRCLSVKASNQFETLPVPLCPSSYTLESRNFKWRIQLSKITRNAHVCIFLISRCDNFQQNTDTVGRMEAVRKAPGGWTRTDTMSRDQARSIQWRPAWNYARCGWRTQVRRKWCYLLSRLLKNAYS